VVYLLHEKLQETAKVGHPRTIARNARNGKERKIFPLFGETRAVLVEEDLGNRGYVILLNPVSIKR